MLLGNFSAEQELLTPPDDLSVRVYREPFANEFMLTVPNPGGEPYTEVMDAPTATQWFLDRGCDAIKLEKALDYAWEYGFYRPVFIKVKRIDTPMIQSRVSPRL